MTDSDSPNIDSLDRWAFDVRKVEKPWGYELIWALTEVYCGKVLFVKAGAAGHIVALGSDGSELDSGGLCISEPPKGADNVGCGHGLVNVSSVVTSLSGEPVIP